MTYTKGHIPNQGSFSNQVILSQGSFLDALEMNLDAGNPLSYPGSGSVWTDLTGKGHNAAPHAVGVIPPWTAGPPGYFMFTANNQYWVVANYQAMQVETVEWWVYNDAGATKQYPWEEWNGVHLVAGELQRPQYWNGNVPVFEKDFVAWTSGANAQVDENNPGANVWEQRVIRWSLDPADSWSTFDFFVNGAFVRTQHFAGLLKKPGAGPADFVIGGGAFDGLTHFAGRIAIVRQYYRNLSDAEINLAFQKDRARFGL